MKERVPMPNDLVLPAPAAPGFLRPAVIADQGDRAAGYITIEAPVQGDVTPQRLRS
jgi:hypothetical protein